MSEAIDLLNTVRKSLYDNFNSQADAIFNTLDSLRGRQKTESIGLCPLESGEARFSELCSRLAIFDLSPLGKSRCISVRLGGRR